MCVYIYVASSKPLRLKRLRSGTPPFKIEHLQKIDRPARKHLTKRHLYFAASFEGCGCIFAEEPPLSKSRSKYAQQCSASHKGFVRWLANVVQRVGAIQVYAVENMWLGRRPRSQTTLQVSNVLSPSFRFREGTLITLSR
jgi:hypothetical protein